ncbi:transposase family protein [Streptomyces marincola]
MRTRSGGGTAANEPFPTCPRPWSVEVRAGIAADRPYYSGKHHRHGMNVQSWPIRSDACCGPRPLCPAAFHDIRAARPHGIIGTLTSANLPCCADKAYRGVGGTVRVPYWGRWEKLSAGQQAHHRSYAKIRGLGEQAVATLETWRLLRKLRCSTPRITDLVKAIPTRHLRSAA